MRTIVDLLKILAVAVAIAVASPVLGALPGFDTPAEAQSVGNVTVTGNNRVAAETVASYLTTTSSQASAADINESIRALFATGLFSDVSITRQGGRLVVAVVENPVINRVAFEGNSRQSDEVLGASIQLQPRSLLSQSQVQSDTQRILEIYRRSGRYNATVDPQVIDLGQNRVDLVFVIDEGPRTEIQEISFVGNEAYSDSRLGSVITSRESGLLGWLRTTDNYDPDRLNADQEALRRFYFNRGYADFRIISATADFDRERSAFFVTFTIEEGEQYTFGNIDVQTTLTEVDPQALLRVASTQPGGVYSAEDIQQSLEDMTIAVAELGYAFVQVRPRGDRNYADNTISVTYFIDEGPRTYIERIEITGNYRTRDYVIRREFDVAEGDAFNQVLIEKAERRLRNLGFFTTVNITTSPGSAPDLVVVNVRVEDEPTGEVSFGAGYSTGRGIIAEVSLTERNFLGRGQLVRIAVGRGEEDQTYDFAFVEPYLFGRNISAGVNAHRRELGDNDLSHPYEEILTGGGVTLGFQIVDNLELGFSYNLENQEITNLDEDFDAFVEEGEFLISTLGYTLTYNTIDDVRRPSDGLFLRFQQEFAGVGGDINYLRTTGRADYYREILRDSGIIGHAGLRGGHVMGVGDDLRFIDHFRLGGETIRGFASAGFGPRDVDSEFPLGGTTYIAGTLEATFPLPLIPADFGLSGAVFADAGTLWGVDSGSVDSSGADVTGDDGDIRASVGVGLVWESPFGLIRADFAYAVLKDDADETELFRLSGGTRF
jgi:outer membrane protein insertion porin family